MFKCSYKLFIITLVKTNTWLIQYIKNTGRPVSHNLLSATVIAPDATLADAYATYCMVVGLDEAKAFIEASEGLEACLVYDQDGEFFMWTSDGIILP